MKMAMLALISYEDQIILHKVINKITKEETHLAMSTFNEYKKKGVILNEFSDDTWIISNEIRNVKLDFGLDEVFLKKHLKSYTTREFINILKYYFCFCLGRYSIKILQKILAHIKKAMKETDCFLVMPKKTDILTEMGVNDFISVLPCANEELIIACVDDTSYKVRRRLVAEYQSYFLFDKLLDKFWEEASDFEKDLYYPIYLWWKISMIIPNRVTEFTVIPKNCIDGEKNKWVLKIRRTQLKGETGKVHGYTLDDDYEIYEYAVSNEIAAMIHDYKARAKKYDEAEIDSLFSDDMFVKLLNSHGLVKTTHLNYSHMILLLEYFYINIIQGKYGYRVLEREEMLMADESGKLKQLNRYEIVRITLGDSRHIAIQNMLLNGCNLLMAKTITGQESANTVFHYSGNIKNFIKCRAYTIFQMSKQKKVAISDVTKTNVSTLLPKPNAVCKEVDGGVCYSVPFVLCQDCRDCFAVAGDCEKCRYFKSKDGSLVIRKEQERIVEEKVERLLEWLDSARMNKNDEEFRLISNQLEASVENLQNGYIQDLREGVKI
jgi:hypothetical protein